MEELMRGIRLGEPRNGLPVDFSSRVVAALGPQRPATWTPGFLAVITAGVLGAAVAASYWAGALVEPEPPALTLYQGGGVAWWR